MKSCGKSKVIRTLNIKSGINFIVMQILMAASMEHDLDFIKLDNALPVSIGVAFTTFG